MVRQWLSGWKQTPQSSSEGSRPRPIHRRRRARHDRRAWVLEGLEGRVLLSSSPTVFMVNSTGSGSTGTGTSGTLPYVIGLANANPNTGGSLIKFDSTVFPASSSTTITLTSTLSLSETPGPEMIVGTVSTAVSGLPAVTVSGGGDVGVFSVTSGVTASITELTIANGSTGTNGGGILNQGTLTISDSTLTGDTAAGLGGGIENNAGTLTVDDTFLAQCSAQSGGGGIEDDGGTLNVSGGGIEDNEAIDGNGGGINITPGTTAVSISISSVSIEDNLADDGGGINIATGTTTTTVTDSTVAFNTAEDGGGIASAATLSVTNSTLTGDTGTAAGGGIDNTGTLTAVNDTIAANDVNSGGTGAGLDAAGGTSTLDNTIVATNVALTGEPTTPSDIAGTVSASSSYNLIGTGGSGGLTSGTQGNIVLTSLSGIGLSTSLADNGGPTETIALQAGSPAIGGGSDSISGVTVPTTDQRGAVRGQSGSSAIDIGAYEVSSTFLVTSTAGTLDAGTLPTAVEWANVSTNANDSTTPNTIIFDTSASGAFATAQTITLSTTFGSLSFTNTTTSEVIDGPGASLLTISGGGAVQVFSVTAAKVTATISGLTITDGSATSGSAIENAGSLTLSYCILSRNSASSGGAGGTIDNTGTLTVSNTTITDNSAYNAGGIENSGTATVFASIISGNSATNTGGGIDNSASMTIDESTVAGNSVVSNLNSDAGGGIDNTGALTIDGSAISGNSIADNNFTSPGNGGGIENGGTLTIDASTISGNSVTSLADDGGIGGGIDNSAGTLTITNSTIADNTAVSGGGISNDMYVTGSGTSVAFYGATLTITSTTIADNVATGGASDGGGLSVIAGSPALYDTIVAMNTDSGGTASDILLNGGSVSSSSAYNLIGTGGSGGLTQGTDGNLVGVADPLLGSLASNGGSTQTIAVLPGSPAIGTGSSTISGATIPKTDQRGVTRPSDSVDIGAFQDQGFTITVVSGNSQSATVDTAFPDPLTVLVTSPSGDPVVGGIVDFTPTGTTASATLSADSATIGANDEARVTATANGQAGSYTVTASVLGTSSPASFSLTNVAAVTPPVTAATVTGISVLWGSQSAALVIPSTTGGALLPAGRVTDIPWLGIDVLQITLSKAETLTASDIALYSARGIKYQVVGVSSNGTSYALFLSRAINASDRITLAIAGSGITRFTGQLNVLPGDFNDNGVVNRQDYYDVRAEELGLGPASSLIFADINGSGTISKKDLNLVRQRFGLRLPRQTTAASVEAVETRARRVADVRIDRDHPGDRVSPFARRKA
jgi:hypothetical protein